MTQSAPTDVGPTGPADPPAPGDAVVDAAVDAVVDPAERDRRAAAQAWRAAAERGTPALALAGTLAPADPGDPDATADASGVRVVWANQAALDLLGLGDDDLDGVGLPDAAPRQRTGQSWPAVAASLLHGPGGRGVGVVRRPDESTRRVQVQVVRLEAGWLVLLVPQADGTSDDRTALAEAEHRFRALAEHAPLGIFLSEAGVRLGYVNAPFAALLGTDPGGLAGAGWVDAIHPDDRPALVEALQAVLSGETRDVEVRLGTPGPALSARSGRADRAERAERADRSGRPPGPDPAPAQRWLHLRLAPTTTPSRAAGFVGTAEDVTTFRAWAEQMSYQAHHDPLTGLANRRRLVTVLADLVESRRGADRAFAVLFFDLDGFKEVNDTLGHEAGDRVLIEVARRMQRTARENDVIARISGDEFVVVLREIGSPDQASAAGRRHLAALAEPFVVSGRRLRLSASLGIALPGAGDTPETLLRSADRVMYEAKAAGPGRYRLAERDTDDPRTGTTTEPVAAGTGDDQ